MKIETKYEIGDNIIFAKSESFCRGTIDEIKVKVCSDKTIIFDYTIKSNKGTFYYRSHKEVYRNSEELFKDLEL